MIASTVTLGGNRALERSRLSDQALASLRDMILTGELTPGGRMTQDELALVLGISTTPVREALLRLAAEGFVEVSPNRSFRIVPITTGDIRDAYWMSAMLQAELASRCCRIADDELVKKLKEHEKAYARAVKARDTTGMEQANWNFHRTVNVAAEAPKIVLILNSALRFVPRDFYRRVPNWATDAAKGHEEIIAAFQRRDPAGAAAATAEHMREAGERLVQVLTAQDAGATPAFAVTRERGGRPA